MITVEVNGRTLSVRFCYNKQYALDVPRKLTHAQRKGTGCLRCGLSAGNPIHKANEFVPRDHLFQKAKPEARYERVLRPLTQCYLEEGVGKERKILEKIELKLHHKDKPYQRNSAELEALRRYLVEGVMRKANLSKDERRCIWHSFLTRRTVRPNVVIPPNTPAAAVVTVPIPRGRRITVVDVPVINDTVPAERRIVVARRTNRSPDGHGVTNRVITPFPDRWNYERMQFVEVGETVH